MLLNKKGLLCNKIRFRVTNADMSQDLEQSFVKNPDIKVKDYLAQQAKASGENFTMKRFVRFQLGEGLAKKVNNFAEEVAAQAKSTLN